MILEGWNSLFQTALMAFIAYCLVGAFAWVSGKPTLARMSAFDFVMALALGTTISAFFLPQSGGYKEEISLLGALFLLQFLYSRLSATGRDSRT